MSHYFPVATGGLFAESEDFSKQISLMKQIAEGISQARFSAEIPLSKAEEMTQLAIKAAQEFSDEAFRMMDDVTNFAVREQIAFIGGDVMKDLTKFIFLRLDREVLNPAKAAGAKTVPSDPFRRNIPAMLRRIIGGYEAFEELDEMKPFFVRNMPATLRFFAKMGQVASTVGVVTQSLKNAVDAAFSMTSMLVDMLKWGTIAGGLYLLYTALKPEGSK